MSADGDIVREALHVPPEGHHRRCATGIGGECDCYMRKYEPALAAIARLEAAEQERNDALVRENGHLRDWQEQVAGAEEWQARGIAAEAQRDALAEALRQWPQDGSVHEPGCAIALDRECDCFTAIARAALAEAGLE